MKAIYDKVSALCSKEITRAYSTSFSLGIYFLSPALRGPIHGIYGFVRVADEIVDSFHNYDKHYLMQKFRKDTVEALEQRISTNPVLNSFQQVVHGYKIDWELIDTFLLSMEMDLERTEHDVSTYNEYILGSAEVVGLMCLKVFTNGDEQLYHKLKPYAMKLGAAFQKVNFLRDMKDDYALLGRTYFPGVDFNKFSLAEKQRIQKEIAADFAEALKGIKMLPRSSRKGVYLAYYYYKKLFQRISLTPPEKIMNTRIRISDINKIGLMFQSLLRHELNMM
jgi:phytoene/squalene synthetase